MMYKHTIYRFIVHVKISLVENPHFRTTFPTCFQLYFLVENNKLRWKILFATENHGSQQV